MARRRRPGPLDEERSLRLLQLGSFCSSVDRFLFAPLIALIALDLGATVSAVALAAAAYFQAYGVMQPVWAVVSDRLGRIRTIRLALLLAAVTGLLSAAAPDAGWLLWSRGLAGACFAAAVPGALMWVGDTVPVERRQAPMTDLMTGAALGIALATAGAGIVGDHLHWRLAVAAPAALAAVLAVLLRRVAEPAVETARLPALRAFGRVLRHRWALVVLGLVLCEGLILVGLLTFLPLTLQSAGRSATVAGLVTAVYGVAVLVGARVVKRLSRRLAPETLVAIGSATGTSAYVVLALDHGVLGVMVGCVCLGATWAFLHTTMQTWVTEVVPEARAAAVSLFASLLFTGGALGSAVGVRFVEDGRFQGLFVAGAIVMATVGLVATVARRRYGRQVAGTGGSDGARHPGPRISQSSPLPGHASRTRLRDTRAHSRARDERERETAVRLGYFSMPLHPLGRSWAETLEEDRAAVILADSLGFHDAFIGEHLTDQHENITNSLLFLATLISDTRQIRLATGTTNLSQQHPALVAANSAMFDHLSNGRFILGISPGALTSDAEALGILHEDRNKIFAEAIDVITAIWEKEAPYSIDLPDNRFKVTTESTMDLDFGVGVMPKPLQQPRPEIVGTVVAPFSKGVIAMGQRDFHPLSANFLLPQWVATHWPNYVEGKEKAGEVADPADWRVARTVFVADDPAVAEAYARTDEDSPYRFYYSQMLKKMRKLGRLELFKTHRDQPDDEITLDYVVDKLVISGTPESVTEQLLGFREEVGEFGELVYAGLDWVDPALARRSMELMAQKVMPEVNVALGSGA